MTASRRRLAGFLALATLALWAHPSPALSEETKSGKPDKPAGAVATSTAQAGRTATPEAATPPETKPATPAAAGATSAAAASGGQVAKPKEPAKPVPTGLERLSDDWPKWLKVGIQYRGRVESYHAITSSGGPYDTYYLNRLRMKATAVVAPWFNASAEVQDSQALDYDLGVVPKSHANTFDLRQAYAEFTPVFGTTKTQLRGGRQEFTLGDGRLMASPDWGNVGRTYDLVRVGASLPGARVDVFGGSPVFVQQGGFDHHTTGERFYGAYVSLDHVVRGSTIDPYGIVRTLSAAVGESGAGDAAIETFGTRWVWKRKAVDSNVEVAMQRGHYGADDVQAWAGHAAFGWTPKGAPGKLRVSTEFNYASGDGDPKDGQRGTFDQLYASNHNKYGLADVIGWRNMRDVAVLAEVVPGKKWRVGAAFHDLALATTNDGLYGSSGTRVVLNRKATSGHVGDEVDAWTNWAISKELSVNAGVGLLFAGSYLDQSTKVARLWTPYLLWNVKF